MSVRSQLRRRAGLSREEVAGRGGVPLARLRRWEEAKAHFSLDETERLARVLWKALRGFFPSVNFPWTFHVLRENALPPHREQETYSCEASCRALEISISQLRTQENKHLGEDQNSKLGVRLATLRMEIERVKRGLPVRIEAILRTLKTQERVRG